MNGISIDECLYGHNVGGLSVGTFLLELYKKYKTYNSYRYPMREMCDTVVCFCKYLQHKIFRDYVSYIQIM